MVGNMDRKLTLEQKAAVEATEKNVLVSAAAGSGKTTVITERLRFLIQDMEVPAESIICITYTRNAADEMKTRLNTMGVNAGFIGTIHAFAYDILGGGLDDGKEFELYSSRHEQMYHKYLIEKYAKYITYDRWQHYIMLENKLLRGEVDEDIVNTYLNLYEETELNLMNGVMYCRSGKEYTKDIVKEMWPHETVIDLCRRDNVISFDELIRRATEYFNKKGVPLEHILVDEFQDVGQLEYKFIQSLHAKNYYFCGDDYQSIYGFKGAEPKIFLSCAKSKDFKVYKLTKNFRCDQSILTFANKIIEGVPNNEKLSKVVVGNSKEVGSTQMISYNEYELLDDIKHLKDTEKKDVFILTRSNGDLNMLKTHLKAAKIDCLTFRQAELTNEEIRVAMESPIIKLLTIHSAKGLEASKVYLVGNFSIMPPQWQIDNYNRSIAEGKKPEYNVWEEQRVFYVGATRAKHFLKIFNKRNQKSNSRNVVSVESMLSIADARKRKFSYAYK